MDVSCIARLKSQLLHVHLVPEVADRERHFGEITAHFLARSVAHYGAPWRVGWRRNRDATTLE
jgi:hypothetical protein